MIMYDVNLRLIGKRVVDLLLVLIELISLGVTAEPLGNPQFQVEGVAPTNHFCTDS